MLAPVTKQDTSNRSLVNLSRSQEFSCARRALCQLHSKARINCRSQCAQLAPVSTIGHAFAAKLVVTNSPYHHSQLMVLTICIGTLDTNSFQ